MLADESCDDRIVQSLRSSHVDIISVREEHQGATDRDVIDLAIQDNRVLITEDRDFGRIVFVQDRTETGVILLRYPYDMHSHVTEQLKELMDQTAEEKFTESFVVVQPNKIRFHKLP